MPSARRMQPLGFARSLHTMVAFVNDNVLWPGNINFLTVNMINTKDGHQVQFTQTLSVPQGQQSIICSNGSVHVSRGYISVYPLTLMLTMFKAVIIAPTGIDVPSELVALTVGQSRDSINPGNLYLRVQQRYDRVLSDQLCDRLDARRSDTARV